MRRQKNNLTNILVVTILLLVVAAGVFIYFSPKFEKNNPTVELETNGYWNLKDKLNIKLNDESGIKSYKIYYSDGVQNILIKNEIVNSKLQDLNLQLDGINLQKGVEQLQLIIEVVDNSNWNFFKGNKTVKNFNLVIDRTRPIANVIRNSYNIKKGGSAAVVVEVKDQNLDDFYISFNDKYRFELIPYLKENYYVAIIAWPVDIEEFDRVNLIVVDKAKNKTITKVPLYIKDLVIKKDNIKISENFIDKVSIPVLQQSNMEIPSNNTEIFVKQNRELRNNNVSKIREVALQNMSREMVSNLNIKPFRRLKNSKTFAGFAERRNYYYDNQKVDEAWHLGMDWASIKHAPVTISNSGNVIFSDYLGIYGNTLIVDHGFGLQSLYAHTSRFLVNEGEHLNRGQKIAHTGSTGAVFGDHLHFGVLVQGIEVNPIEWMDKNWIKTRITDILSDAKKVINSK